MIDRRIRYRCVALRECTTAHEHEDTREGMWTTKAAIRLVEAGRAYSAPSHDLMGALNAIDRQ